MAETRVEGLAELLDAFKNLPRELALGANRSATASAAAVVRDQAKQDAPYMSAYEPSHAPPGTLRNAIQIKRVRSDAERSEYVVFVRQGPQYRAVNVRTAMHGPMLPGQRRKTMRAVQNQDAFYWRFVEFGTVHAKRYSFMAGALDKSADSAINAYADAFKSRYDAAVAKVRKGKL